MKTSRLPHDLTLECRRIHRRRIIVREIAWACVLSSAAILAMSIGTMLATANNPLFAILSGAILLAGILGARHLLIRH